MIGLLIVDPATGAMYDLPKFASASMVQLPTPSLGVTPINSASAPTVASAAPTDGAMSREQWKVQQLQMLKQQQGLSYEEYQRRHQAIVGNQ
ncbi:hypothetical protein FQZ97_1109110 [compost metagenome]